MNLRRTIVLIIGLLLISTASISARKWTDTTGKFPVEAELVEVKDGSVKLKKRDGKIITLPVSTLSKADRDFLAAIAHAKKKPAVHKPERVVEKALTEEQAIAKIKEMGGNVVYRNAVMEVRLSGTKVTDAGLSHLKGLTNLQTLWLTGTWGVTDAGLEHLKALTKLKSLHLDRTNVTDEGVEKLQQALPDCYILH